MNNITEKGGSVFQVEDGRKLKQTIIVTTDVCNFPFSGQTKEIDDCTTVLLLLLLFGNHQIFHYTGIKTLDSRIL